MDLLNKYNYCPACKNDLILAELDKQKVKKCINCNFIFWNNLKPVTSILLYKDNKILMIQRQREPLINYWVFPGGFLKSAEIAEDAVKRESKEEIGLEVKIEGTIGTYLIDNDPRGMHLDVIFFGTADGEIKLSEEDKKWQYFSPNNLPDKIAYKHREAILDWHKNR
jgi:ADP-ribose pyrophosphatase YjhB (NUDIX family)